MLEIIKLVNVKVRDLAQVYVGPKLKLLYKYGFAVVLSLCVCEYVLRYLDPCHT